jgi:hypothetical protein
MEPVAPSSNVVAVLRTISRAGFAYAQTKELAEAAGWKLIDDELDLGYVRFDVQLVPGRDVRRPLAVEVCESGRPPRAFVPLFYFEEHEVRREPFDKAHRSLSEQLTRVLGPPSLSGEYCYQHREEWIYLYSWWSLADAEFVLVQDEFDIQFGMDVSLWVLPAGAAVEFPMSSA